MKCVKLPNDVVVRMADEDAESVVQSGQGKFTSKSKYKRQVSEMEKRHVKVEKIVNLTRGLNRKRKREEAEKLTKENLEKEIDERLKDPDGRLTKGVKEQCHEEHEEPSIDDLLKE